MGKYSFTYKKLIIFLFIIILPVNALGCRSSSKKEIEKIYLVLAIGIDPAPEDKVEVTMQILSPNPTLSQTGPSSGSGNDVIVMKSIAETFHEASYEILKNLNKVAHYGHIKYIVLSDAFARRPIGDFIDSLTRIEEFRLNVPILITKEKASDIIETAAPDSPMPALVVENLYLTQGLVGFRPFSYLIDFINELNSKAASPVAAVINLKKAPPSRLNMLFDMSGTAVFKKDVLIGYLNAKNTRGLQLIKGYVEIGDITLHSDKFGKVSCAIIKTSSKIKPKVNGSKITMEVDIKVVSSIRRISASIDPIKNPEILEELNAEQNKAIKNEVQATLNAAKNDLNADIFGFADYIYKANPKFWKSVEKDWDSIFSNMDVIVKVESNIRSTGLASKSST